LAQLYAKHGQLGEIERLFVDIRPFLGFLPKVRTAKVVRTLYDTCIRANAPIDLQLRVTTSAIEWCKKEKRTFLKQRMEARLASLLLQSEKFKDAIALITRLVREVKKFDDKLLLVEIYLIESRVHLHLQNVPKSKGALTSARSAANAIYCPPLLQAQIDLQAGTLCAEEKDYKTGYSYFYEAFEGYNTINDPFQATSCLKYMLLTKIMLDQPEEVNTIVNGKGGLKYAGVELEAMREVAIAYKKRSIHAFQDVYSKYMKQLQGDPIINSHLNELRAKLLEQNLLRLVEPFSRVEIAHVAKLINLPLELVEAKLSEMILDTKLHGILDQGIGILIVFEESPNDKTYDHAVGTVRELSGVVDRLYTKAKRLQ